MGDWLHCNSCIRMPNPKDNCAFYFTSCGHIICATCYSSGDSSTCRHCQKRASVVEINRSLKPECQMFFRNPKDLLEQYVKNLNSVLDFQAGHRSRLAKARQEQQKKAMKFVMSAQVELKRKTEVEKKSAAEKDVLTKELEKLRHHCQKLEKVVASHEAESRHRNRTPTSAKKGDKDDQLRFSFIATSTPISDLFNNSQHRSSGGRSNSVKKLVATFAGGEEEPSPIQPALPDSHLLTTPDMLGVRKASSMRGRTQIPGFVADQFGFN